MKIILRTCGDASPEPPAEGETVVLLFSEAPPHFIFDDEHSWERFGIRPRELSRYWLSEYRDIRNRVASLLSSKQRPNPDICATEEFIFGLVSVVGARYYDPLVTLHRFFMENRVESIEMPEPDGWFGGAVKAYCVSAGIPVTIRDGAR